MILFQISSGVCLLRNGYLPQKWNRQADFKFPPRLFDSLFALISLKTIKEDWVSNLMHDNNSLLLWWHSLCNGYRGGKWTWVQILNGAVCISHCTFTLGKGIDINTNVQWMQLSDPYV